MNGSRISPKRAPLKLLLAAFLGLLIALLILALLPPWLFVRFLTHPGCRPITPIAGLPRPEEFWLKTTGGLEVRAWYYPSQNGAAILAMGGMSGSLGANLPPVDMLIRHGYGVLQIDSRACGRPPAPVTLGYQEAEDAAAGLAFLRRRSEISPQRIGIFGFSMGGAAAIRCAARQPSIAAVVSEGAYANLGQNFTAYGQGDFYTRLTGALASLAFWAYTGVNPALSSPVEDIAAIAPRPVLIIYGEGEVGVPSQALWEAARAPKQLCIIPGGTHGANHLVAPQEYERCVVEFFNLALFQQSHTD